MPVFISGVTEGEGSLPALELNGDWSDAASRVLGTVSGWTATLRDLSVPFDVAEQTRRHSVALPVFSSFFSSLFLSILSSFSPLSSSFNSRLSPFFSFVSSFFSLFPSLSRPFSSLFSPFFPCFPPLLSLFSRFASCSFFAEGRSSADGDRHHQR